LFEFRTVELEFLLQPATSRTLSETMAMSLEVILKVFGNSPINSATRLFLNLPALRSTV
jgi:hypothetical protein